MCAMKRAFMHGLRSSNLLHFANESSSIAKKNNTHTHRHRLHIIREILKYLKMQRTVQFQMPES